MHITEKDSLVEGVAVALEAHVLGRLRRERKGLHDPHVAAGFLAGDDGGPLIITRLTDGNVERINALLLGGLHEEADRHAVHLLVILELERNLGALPVDRVVLVEVPVQEVFDVILGVGELHVLDLDGNHLEHGSAVTLPALLRVDFENLGTAFRGVLREIDTGPGVVVRGAVIIVFGCWGWRGGREAVDIAGQGARAGRLSVFGREVVFLCTLELARDTRYCTCAADDKIIILVLKIKMGNREERARRIY